MSFRGRYAIDRIKRSVGKWLKLPVPPYENTNYWEGVYQSLGADDCFEWADVACRDLARYSYRSVPCRASMRPGAPRETATTTTEEEDEIDGGNGEGPVITTTLQETLGLVSSSSSSSNNNNNNNNTKDDPDNPKEAAADDDEDQPVLILGCGNSKFGEDLLEAGLPCSPIVQIDVSQRVVETLSARCHEHLQSGDMLILQDDATVLSAIPSASCQAVVDKGLLDSLFCADAHPHCWEVLHAAHRVLRPDGILVVLSLSRPEFLLRRLMIPDHPDGSDRYVRRWQAAWSRVECRQSDFIYLYRFTKASGGGNSNRKGNSANVVHNVVKKSKKYKKSSAAAAR